ncbi:MAG: aldo/keto reductase [Erysipelotrichaceae bacterium]
MEKVFIKGIKDGKDIQIGVSKVILGASDYFRKDNIEYAENIINKYHQVGGNCFDTAHHYRYCDEAIAEYFKRNNNREEFVIFAKGCHPVREYPHIPRVNREGIIKDLEASLEKLNVDFVELFALHRDDENVPVSEIMETLDYLVKSGKILAIGTSNWSTSRIIEANEYALDNNLVQFTFKSPNLSLAKPVKQRWPNCISADEEMLSWHHENNVPLLSWSAQASGFLSGNFNPKDKSNEEMVESFYSNDNWKRMEQTQKYADKLNVTPITVSLAWVLNQSFPTAAIIGPETLVELDQSLEALDIKLSGEDCNILDVKKSVNIDHKIALQLYSVRKELEKDMSGTLKRIANMGYKYVQLDGFRGNNMWEFREELEKNNLQVVGIHFKHSRFWNDIEGIIRESLIFNCKNIYDKYIDEEDQNTEGYRSTKKQLLKVNNLLTPLNFHIGLHNPEYDFNAKVDGLNCMDYICKPEDGGFIYPELDTYWIYVAGHNPNEYINKYKGKIDIIHCKDIDPNINKMDLTNNLVPCGRGAIDFKELIRVGEEAEINYYVIEQDVDSSQDIMKSIEESLIYLQRIGREVLS